MKQAQMEMIGLAFVVVIMVLGLLLYLAFAALPQGAENDPRAVREARDYGSALQTAMLATRVEGCTYDLSTALNRCLVSPTISCGTQGLVCQAANNEWKKMLDTSLGENANNIAYLARIEQADGDVLLRSGEFFEQDGGCLDAQNTLAGPSQPIPTEHGTLRFIITFC